MAFIRDADRTLLEQRFRDELPSAVTLQLFTTPRFGLYIPRPRKSASPAPMPKRCSPRSPTYRRS